MTDQEHPKPDSTKSRVSVGKRRPRALAARGYDAQGREVLRFYKPTKIETLVRLDEVRGSITIVWEQQD